MNNRHIYRVTVVLILAATFIISKAHSNSLSLKGDIDGIVMDSLSREGLPFASVQLLSRTDSSIVNGTMTDAKGNFRIESVQYGNYWIVASYMGYSRYEKELDIQSRKVKCDFYMHRRNISLSEVSITADRSIIEHKIDKTTINVSKNLTVSGGTATDVLQTLPSVDIDIDGNIMYRGSDKVLILVNGEKSELVKSLDQIPAEQIERIDLINNPSAKYEAEGMSGIINIVIKSGSPGDNKTTLRIQTGYPETFGGNMGYSGGKGDTRFFVNGGIKHNTRYQIKEHLRENYENTLAFDYSQYDKQDQMLNDLFFNSNLEYTPGNKQRIGFSFISSKKFDNASRIINYETLGKSGITESKSLKEIGIDLDNHTIDGTFNYRYRFDNNGIASAKFHYSLFSQLHQMNSEYYPVLTSEYPDLQNTFSRQINKQRDFSLNYLHPFSNSIQLESGYHLDNKDLMNDFNSESYHETGEWISDTALINNFSYKQLIHSAFSSLTARLKRFELQAGIRGEFTTCEQNDSSDDKYLNVFPSINISQKLNKHNTIFAGYNRRINRPTIKMLNPYTYEYADLLNQHKGNPDLKPEYVSSIEIGNRFIFDQISGLISVYHRNIDQAISRVKSASDESALFVTYINLEKAKLIGGEVSINYKPYDWWNINSASNIFYTSLSGEYRNNLVNNSKIGWTLNVSSSFKMPYDIGLQFSAFYRSKLPSVMGTYIERYYLDLAFNKKILKNRAQLIFKISDVFDTYLFGLDIDAMDMNNYRYSQRNRRKNESQYFILSFIYNINGKDQEKKQKDSFFLDGFDK